ncbi:hypothetical protein A2914_01930 [Candidatus Nomurabacteria bacterium RIFCSPLOWO2_01_FULL_41_21]|uniref:Secretion system C-terminal sorting domain-containing protein n=1 Tax=Candidatus Nomurabacteria bacterium RIFCSPLOWO2_01_FULL_41_21 TaxID=1801776 RepID=A0A1F6X342_9BACT|nr:MAG: hypothetical protein A2914_01930 [Candidatus Nomurabacteria bacterium RIFCSPLOWO2_01_FULL_41_21]
MKNVIFLFLLAFGLSNTLAAQSSDESIRWVETQEGTVYSLDQLMPTDTFRIVTSFRDTSRNTVTDWQPITVNNVMNAELAKFNFQYLQRSSPDVVTLDQVIILSSSSVQFVVSYSGPSEGRWIRVNFGTVEFGVNEFNTISYWVESTSGTFTIDQFTDLIPGRTYFAKAFEHWPQIVDSEVKTFTMTFVDPCASFSVGIDCSDLSLCEGSSLTLNAVTHGGGNCDPLDFKWSDGQTGSMITVMSGGTYTVTVTDENDCKATESVVVTMDPKPFAFIWSSIGLGLKGDKVILMAQDNGMGYWLFDWSTGEMTSTIIVDEVKTYRVTVTDSRTGCSAETSYSVPEIPKCEEVKDTCSGGGGINVDFDLDGSIHIPCGEGPWPTLSVPYVPDWNYLWYMEGVFYTTPSIVVKKSGTYYLTITVNGQSYAFQHYVQLIVGTSPLISTSPDTVYSCPGESVPLYINAPGHENEQLINWFPYYQMSCQNCRTTIVAPFHDQEYTSTLQIGDCVYERKFWVLMKSSWDCNGVTDTNYATTENIVVFPNPVLREGSVEITGLPLGDYHVDFSNSLGQSTKTVHSTGDNVQLSIEELDIPSGVYTVRLKEVGGKIYAKRLTIL